MPIRVPSRTATPIHLRVVVVVILLLFLAMAITRVSSSPSPSVVLTSHCPSSCECKWMNGKESVRCHNTNLTEIPQQLDAGTQVLDLQRNEIVRLDGDEFSAVNLLNLQKIFLIECQLTQLHRYAFRNLINLVELDLSDNRLTAVPSHVFDSMSELRELRLSGNPVLRLDNAAFNGLGRLVRLELSNCRIRRIEVRAFDGVRQSLEWLKLDGNELINVQPTALTILNNLHGIELTRNNWNCTCTLRPLRQWMLQQNIPYEFSPVCAYPERLKDRPWSRMDVDEFACAPLLIPAHYSSYSKSPSPSTANNNGGGGGVVVAATGTAGAGAGAGAATSITVKAIEGQNVTIGCDIVAGNPDPTIRWMFRNRVIVANVSLRSTSGGHSFAAATSSTSSSSSSAPAAAAGQPEGNNVVASGGSRSSTSVAAITTLDTRKKFYHHLGQTGTNVTIAWIDNHDAGVYKCIGENGAGRSEATISLLVYSRHYLIDSNNNVIEASVALAHSNNRFIFIISTAVAVLFVIFSLLLAICYYTVHRKNTRANANAALHRRRMHQQGLGGATNSPPPGVLHRKKVLNKKSFSFLLCQNRSESYEKIEMLATMNPHATSNGRGAERGPDETSGKIYCERRVDGDEEEGEGDDEEELSLPVSRATGGMGGDRAFGKLSPESQSVRDKRRTMSLNLSNSPMNLQRKKVRNYVDYSNVPTTADEDSAGHDKLMMTARATASNGGGGTDWKLFTKHQAQSRSDDEPPTNRETTQQKLQFQSQWLGGGQTTNSFLPHGELGIGTTTSASAVNVHQKVNRNCGSTGRNINLSTLGVGGGANFSHPLADLCKTTTTAGREPLINIDAATAAEETNSLDLLQSAEVIRHHVMRKRILSSSLTGGDEDGVKEEGIVIYTTTREKSAAEASGPESSTTDPGSTTIIGGGVEDFMDEFDESDDKLGRLSPTLNSIMRNDENFDLFDVKSNLDDFYVKQLNYDYLQQRQNQMLFHNHQQKQQRFLGNTGGGGSNYFSSLPRKRGPVDSKKNLMAFSTISAGSCGEESFDAPLEESLFRQQQRQKSTSELNLMSSFEEEPGAPNGSLSFISGGGRHSTTLGDNNTENGRQGGTIIKPLSENNKATPLLNFPTTAHVSTKVTGIAGMSFGGGGGGGAIGSGSGIFPSNCASPSIIMGSNGSGNGGASAIPPPLASSILSPTNVSGGSSSSPSSSSVSSSAKKSLTSSVGAKGVGGHYDYHAAQLEMFLDEYKRLQLQLCKMKETCDSIRRTEMIYGNYSSTSAGGANNNQFGGKRLSGNKSALPASISSALSGNDMMMMAGGATASAASAGIGMGMGAAYDPYYPMNNTLLEKSNVVLLGNESTKTLPKNLAFSKRHKSYSGSTPEPPPYWLHRNELLKGIQTTTKEQTVKPPIPLSRPDIFGGGSSGLGGKDQERRHQSHRDMGIGESATSSSSSS